MRAPQVRLCSPQRRQHDTEREFADAPISFVKQEVLSQASQSTEEEKEEASQFSEGQLVSTGCQSDDSELSEEIMEGKTTFGGPSHSELCFSLW